MSLNRTDLNKAGWLYNHPDVQSGFPESWLQRHTEVYGALGVALHLDDAFVYADDELTHLNANIEPMMSIEKSMKDVIAETLKDGYLNIGRPAKVGDLVRIVKGFRYVPDEHCGQLAVVSKISTSFDGRKELVLTHKGNKTAWWNQDQLNFIKADQLHLVDEWKMAEIRRKKRLKSFDFLVKWANKYPENSPPKECISFIWEQINPGKSMWGSRGEGMSTLMNSLTVIRVWITVVRSFNKPVTDQNKAQFRKHLVSVVNTFRKANKASSNV